MPQELERKFVGRIVPISEIDEEIREQFRHRWYEFEEDIRTFLKKLGFKDISGGRNLVIGGVQIDAIGGYGNTLFVIECLSSTRRKKASVRGKIKEFKGVVNAILNGLNSHSDYKKNNMFCLF